WQLRSRAGWHSDPRGRYGHRRRRRHPSDLHVPRLSAGGGAHERRARARVDLRRPERGAERQSGSGSDSPRPSRRADGQAAPVGRRLRFAEPDGRGTKGYLHHRPRQLAVLVRGHRRVSAVPHDTGLGDSPEVEEFEVIAPQRERVVRFRGEDLTVRPVTIRQLAGFAPHARPLVAAVNERFAGLELSEEAILGAVNLDLVLSLVENYSEHVIGAVAAATGK